MAAVAISDATDGRRILALSGRLEATTIRGVWDESRRAIAAAPDQRVVVDAADVQVANLRPAFETLLQQFDAQALGYDLDPPAPRRPAVEEIGVIAADMGEDLRQQIVFIGETAAALLYALRHPSTIRWKDVWR